MIKYLTVFVTFGWCLQPTQNPAADSLVSDLQSLSKEAGDNLFYVNYDFLRLIESQNQGKRIDGELEHEWQMRRTKVMEDLMWSMYNWIQRP